ncbi:hypothetical protein GGI43DRAFT_7816 [Trichoderma evansii]
MRNEKDIICMSGVGKRMDFDLTSFFGSAPVWFAFFIMLYFKGKDTTFAALDVCLSHKRIYWRAGFSSVFMGCTWMYYQCYLYVQISRILFLYCLVSRK